MAEGTRTNNLAIVSMVAGIVGWVALPLIGHVVAVVTGHMAQGQIRAAAGAEDGQAFALIGLVLGYIGLLGTCLLIALIGLGIVALTTFLSFLPFAT